MPLSQRKADLAIRWYKKHYEPEYIAQLLNTTTEEIQTIINQHTNKPAERKIHT